MKHLPLIVAMVLVVAACNLTNKFKKTDSTNSNSSSTTSSSGNPTSIEGEPVEKPAPTAAQIAVLANGQEVKWDQQGITWTLPANWKKQEVRNESLSYVGDGAFLTLAISMMGAEFPTDLSIKAKLNKFKQLTLTGKD